MQQLLLSVVIVAAVAVPVGAQEPQNIIEVAVEAGSFSTLARAVQAAGLVETLQGDGPFTVFAPTDAAFAKLPEGTLENLLEPDNIDRLRAILGFHVVEGRFDAGRALSARALDSLNGAPLSLRLVDGSLRVNGARVISNDVNASNGVIHVIDTVLLPPAKLSSAAAMMQVLELAIERGVPLFNEGDEAACAAVYEVAITSIVSRPADLDSATLQQLRKALATVEGSRDASANAWTLRRAMDRTLVVLSRQSAEKVTSRANDGELLPLFAFDASSDAWLTVNDDVMGGISRARYQLNDGGTASFRGALSLENNGGFATIRSPGRDLGITGFDGLVMRVRGDGRTYGLSALPSSNRWEINIWRTQFETVAGEWMEIRVPFSSLKHNVMGRRVRGSGPLPPSKIKSLSFSISDKNEEPFELEIDWIKAYKDDAGVASK